jgi:uncharacterized DUF497 family protein
LKQPTAESAVEWDEKKSLLKLKKHRVTFEEAATVFGDPLELTTIRITTYRNTGLSLLVSLSSVVCW